MGTDWGRQVCWPGAIGQRPGMSGGSQPEAEMSGDSAVSDFARLLEELKRRSGRSYDALARRAGLSSSTLHRWCRGDRVPPEFLPVDRYARVCGVSRDELAELRRRWVRAEVAYRQGTDRQGTDRQGTD